MVVNGLQVRMAWRFGCRGGAWPLVLALVLDLGALGTAWAAPRPADCAKVEDPVQRLACYDNAAAASPPAPPPAMQGGQAPDPADWMSTDWELDAAHKRGTFHFFTYRPNFILPLHYSSAINRTPQSPSPGRDATLPEYRNVETKLQISLRTKLAEDILLPQADLWFGYTQVSLWQLWSGSLSAPFRSTDYEPELIYVVPAPAARAHLPGGWRWRFTQVAFAHQSNGQAMPLSRSWNRVYAAAGLDRGALSAVVRVARRMPEDSVDDDNPDLSAYRGRGDLALTWDGDQARTGLTWRSNLRDLKRGSLELNWLYPVSGSRNGGLNAYVQVFSGYGETLLDYNFRQTSIGLGVTLFNF